MTEVTSQVPPLTAVIVPVTPFRQNCSVIWCTQTLRGAVVDPIEGPHKDDLFGVGDVLFLGSIGRTDFPRGNHGDLINAITRKLWPLGDEVTFIPGHGPTSTFGHERRTNPHVSDAALA